MPICWGIVDSSRALSWFWWLKCFTLSLPSKQAVACLPLCYLINEFNAIVIMLAASTGIHSAGSKQDQYKCFINITSSGAWPIDVVQCKLRTRYNTYIWWCSILHIVFYFIHAFVSVFVIWVANTGISTKGLFAYAHSPCRLVGTGGLR